MRMTLRRAAITAGIALALVTSAGLLYAVQLPTIIFDAEAGKIANGQAFRAMKYTEDATGAVSGNKVLAVPKLKPGEKMPKDEVSYQVRIQQTGTYYLWARTYWSNGCGNSFFLRVEGYKSGEWIIGGDGTYDALHWVCLSDDGDNSSRPRPLQLKKGVVTITLGAKESGARVDEFLLTMDRKRLPAGMEKVTPNALVVEKEAAKK